MRSDKEEIPADTSKADADQAEIKEAKLTNPDTPRLVLDQDAACTGRRLSKSAAQSKTSTAP